LIGEEGPLIGEEGPLISEMSIAKRRTHFADPGSLSGKPKPSFAKLLPRTFVEGRMICLPDGLQRERIQSS